MSVNKIVTKVDGTINKTIDFNDLKAGLASGAHTITVEAFNGATLISTQTRNITIAAGVSYEAETTLYMNTLGIADDANSSIYTGVSNNGVWLAVDEYIADLKTAVIYNKLHYNYLRVGDDATKQAVDLINPTRSGVYFGSWIFGKDGATANGVNCYFKAIANPLSLDSTSNNFGMSYVINVVFTTSEKFPGHGIYSPESRTQMYIQWDAMDKVGAYIGDIIGSVLSSSAAFHTVNRTADIGKYYSNGVEKLSTSQGTTTLPNAEMYECAANWFQTSDIKNYVKGDLGVTAYHQNLTASETLAFSNAVSKLETALGRKRY